MRLAGAPPSSRFLLFVFSLWVHLFSHAVVSQDTSSTDSSSRDCFYPDGIQSKGLPCFPDQAVSPCCGHGFICLSNGLCEPGPDLRRTYQYKIYRSACTDSTWNSSSCPRVCIGSSDNLESGQGLAACGTNGSYCCGRGYDCCSKASNIFNYGAASAVTTLPYSSATSSAATSSSSSASSSTSSSSSNHAIAIGVGVGVGVGVGGAILVSATIALLLYRRRRRKNVPSPDSPSSAPRPSVLPSSAPPDLPQSPLSELHPQSTSELPPTTKDLPQELHGQQQLRSELPGSTKDPGPPPEYYPLMARPGETGAPKIAARHELEG